MVTMHSLAGSLNQSSIFTPSPDKLDVAITNDKLFHTATTEGVLESYEGDLTTTQFEQLILLSISTENLSFYNLAFEKYKGPFLIKHLELDGNVEDFKDIKVI